MGRVIAQLPPALRAHGLLAEVLVLALRELAHPRGGLAVEGEVEHAEDRQHVSLLGEVGPLALDEALEQLALSGSSVRRSSSAR